MEPIKKVTMSDAVHGRLLEMIRGGELRPGDKIPTEGELCKLLGASRTVIREGIRGLARMNVVAVLPGRGTYVNADPDILVDSESLAVALEREMIESIYEVRSILDTGIARYAAMKATDSDVANIERALQKTWELIQATSVDLDSSLKGDEEFHRALCEAAHNRVLQKIAWPIINHQILKFWRHRTPSLEIVKKALRGHERIADAVKRRDPEAAQREMEKHLSVAFGEIYKPHSRDTRPQQ